MNIVHLMASPFVGGPERQVLGLAAALPPACRTSFLSFAEGGRAQAFVDRARQMGFEARALRENMPHLRRSVQEIAAQLRQLRADVLCCSGYKPDILGWRAARRAGIPVVSISHGWTAATWKVRCNELLDRLVLHGMDAVVCVSHAQALRVRRALVPQARAHVIPNAISLEPFASPDPAYREKLHAYFGRPRRHIVVAAGRISPEKGFEILVAAASHLFRASADLGIVIFGDGPQREALRRQIDQAGLKDQVILAGFRTDVERFLPWCDLGVLSSYTEGMPVAVLETLAAGVPVVATSVGGTPEVVEQGVHGYLVPPGDPTALAGAIARALQSDAARRQMGQQGRRRIEERFTFSVQAARYLSLFEHLVQGRSVNAAFSLATSNHNAAIAACRSPGS